MNVSCPECRTVYRIDPRKVPDTGIRARCIRCPGEFDISVEAEEVEAPSQAADSADDTQVRTAEGSRVSGRAEPGSEEMDEAPAQPDQRPAPTSDAESRVEPELPPAPFGSSDPRARARRLARVLVSDIVVYHPERRERSLRDGTIRQEFRDEIRKSWEEYVSQVGNEIARETSYFQEALNEILADGSRVF